MTEQLLMLGPEDEDDLQPEYDISASEDEEEKDEDGEMDEDEDGDEDHDSKSTHSKLMKAISSMDAKKRSKIKQRSEPATEVSEFHLNKVTDERGVKVHELVKTLKNTAAHSDIRKQLNNFQKKTPTLKTPLYKHEADKIQRTLAYQATSKDVSKWDEVVNSNRKAEHLSFPLNQESARLQSTEAFVKKFKPATSLEQQVYQLLKGSKHREQKGKDLSVAEEDALKAMSLKEAQERRAELQKYRALQSYYEAKCRRQKKIKSKKYHRIQRKSKAKEESKKLATMIESNPEEAQELLMKMEKSRAEERMSLKHKNTGKWAKTQIRFGKYNKEARELLQEQLQKSRDLTQKIADANMSDNEDESAKNELISDDDTENNDTLNSTVTDVNNPWFDPSAKRKLNKKDDQNNDDGGSSLFPTLQPVVADDKEDVNVVSDSSDSENDDDSDNYKNGITKSDIDAIIAKKTGRTIDADDDEWSELDDGLIAEGLERRQTLEKLNENWESDNDNESKVPTKSTAKVDVVIEEKREKEKKHKHIDPNKVFTIQPKEMNALAPNLMEDEEMTEIQEQRMNIQQAFADDDVVDEFQEEKAKKMDEDAPKDVDLTLPGWGDWGGHGVKPSKNKKRFIVKAPPAKPRKDDNLHHVIINEKRDKHVAMHQVNDLPSTFTHTKQFERTIRAPIGSHWNTALTVKSLTTPKVSTKLGTVIEPISAADVFEDKEKKKKRDRSDDGKGGKRKADIMLDDSPQKKKRQRNRQKGKKNAE
ncbi:LOW QUALITY PROTEIN: U3 small nucleolar RNA-associated protein 14 homolog A-like [Amphiura filiformis]|uniref:LOW QUALITY PROTEIN: U3 small nucleolar RNA-associated protein 14 homolog A-like n=1 Tax=Amphiura filiformis TaxID=82378 RepID=UPI003B219054